MKLTICFVSRYQINKEGHGGHHRTYQIWHDLCQLVGEENVYPLALKPDVTIENNSPKSNALVIEYNQRLNFLKKYITLHGNPSLLYKKQFIETSNSNDFFPTVPTNEYTQLISSLDKPVICILDHPEQSNLIDINKQNNIPTIICPQNIEAFDTLAGSFERKFQTQEFFHRFFQELRILSRCDERLCISKVEAGILGGLGLTTHFYPYLPVGEIRAGLEKIRAKRNNPENTIEKNHFLMLGSASHHTTDKSILWFLDQASKHGLPEGIHVSIAGKGTEKYKTAVANNNNISILGWLKQDDLDALLCKVRGVSIPQLLGFGALTRLPEMSCAGIPTLVSTHPTYAVDNPPGIYPVSDDWKDWCKNLSEFSHNHDLTPTQEQYENWVERQPRPLEAILRAWHNVLEN